MKIKHEKRKNGNRATSKVKKINKMGVKFRDKLKELKNISEESKGSLKM